MSQNLVIPNKDNKVVFVFGGIDLTAATNIVVNFGAETYSLISDPLLVVVNSATELSLDLSSTTEVGQKYITVTYIDGASVNGTDITSRELGNLGRIIVAIGTQLIIEDGTVVANANSLVSDEEYKAYADLRGLTIAPTQPEREAHLVAAMDYLHSIESKIQGCRLNKDQTLLFPRRGVCLYGHSVPSDHIPNEIKNAQMEAAFYQTSNSLLTNSSNDNIRSEKMDTLQVEYFAGGSMTTTDLQRVNAQLGSLLKPTNTLTRI